MDFDEHDIEPPHTQEPPIPDRTEDWQLTRHARPESEPQKSAKELWAEIGRLLLLLLWTIVKKVIRLTYKSVRLIIAFAKLCAISAKDWWQDKSTQEKVRAIKAKIRHWSRKAWQYTRRGSRTLWHWTVAGSKATAKYAAIAARQAWKGLVWLCVNLIQLIIHTKPMLIQLWKAVKRGCRQGRQTLKQASRGARLRRIRQKRRYRTFKQNGGMKGLLEETSRALKTSIQSYMEEEQDDVAPEAITEDDIIEARFERMEQNNRAHAIGKKFFTSVRNIVEEDG